MNISIITATWGRERLFRVFLNSIKRYYQDFGIQTMIAGSEGVKTRDMCLDAGAGYVEVPNSPLSGKFNAAIMAAHVNYKPDGFMILGSDDFVNGAVIKLYQYALKNGVDVAGFKDCYYYNAKMGEAVYWPGYTVAHRVGESIGMGRLLSLKAFRAVKGRPWSEANRGLDWLMNQRLKGHKTLKRATYTMKGSNCVMVDIKGFGGISSLGSYDTEPVDINVFDTIPEFEDILKL